MVLSGVRHEVGGGRKADEINMYQQIFCFFAHI